MSVPDEVQMKTNKKKDTKTMENRPENDRSHRHRFFCASNGSAIATGVAVGVAIGLALNNLALGIAIGIAIYGWEDYDSRHRDE
jgi:hypothetical protein